MIYFSSPRTQHHDQSTLLVPLSEKQQNPHGSNEVPDEATTSNDSGGAPPFIHPKIAHTLLHASISVLGLKDDELLTTIVTAQQEHTSKTNLTQLYSLSAKTVEPIPYLRETVESCLKTGTELSVNFGWQSTHVPLYRCPTTATPSGDAGHLFTRPAVPAE